MSNQNKQYFRDMDVQGNLISGQASGSPASWDFYKAVLEERARTVSFQVSARASSEWEGQKWLEENTRKEIEKIEKETWEKALKKVLLGGRREIGAFPDEQYHLHTLQDGKGKTYEVKLDCRKLIENHKIGGLQWVREEKDKLMQPYWEHRDLRTAAVLSAVHLLLNLTTTLSCLPGWRWLYPWDGLRVIWALFVAGIMLVAMVRHLSKTIQPLFTLLMILGTFAYQSAGPDMRGVAGEILSSYTIKLETQEAMMVLGLMLAVPSLFCCLLYTIHACRAKVPQQDWRSWIGWFDARAEGMHRELCFLKLWYKHMTGKECPNLKEQEDVLSECVALAEKHRR